MEFIKNYLAVRKTIPENVMLIAVSKFSPFETILTLYNETGHSLFGESRAQELALKQAQLPVGISWHFIGHLQTNKIKLLLAHTSLIQSVDSYRLLKEINRESAQLDKVTDVLLQFHVATEETKFGLSKDETVEMIMDKEFNTLQNIKLKGVMGMASFTDDHSLVRKEFKTLRRLFEELRRDYFASDASFSEVSMGMSSDYTLAIEEGSTMVRIGSLIFGER